jgi:hypothetical protein
VLAKQALVLTVEPGLGGLQKFEEKAHDFSREMNPTIPTQSILDSTAYG